MPADQHLPAIIARLESLEERVATLEQLLADASALHKSLSLPLDGCAEGEALTAPARPEEGHRAAPGFVDAEELSSYPFLGTGERLQLFMRLFAHRRDRYAQRSMSKDRAGAYGKEGRLYVGTALKADLFADIDGARSELVICSPQLHRSRFHQVLRACVAAQRRGVRVLVVTQALDDYAPQKREAAAVLLQMLEESGVRHEERSQVLHRFMTVDGRFSWYGSVSVMGYWSKEDCVARFEDEGIVSMLHEGIRFQMG